MTLQELIDYTLTISASVAAEPSAQPILDAGLALQYLLPVVFREVTRKVAKSNPNLQSLVKPHPLEINQNFAAIPDGLEEEFSNSFQVGLITPRLVRTITGAAWGIGLNVVKTGAGFTSADIGRTVDLLHPTTGAVLNSDTVQDVPNGNTLVLANTSGSVVPCTIQLYETQWVLETEFLDVDCAISDPGVTVNSAEVFAASDLGKLVVVYDAGIEVFRSLVDTFNSSTDVDLVADSPANVVSGTTNLYRIAEISEALENYYTAERVGLFSHYQGYSDFIFATDDILPKFCVRDRKIFVKEANDADIADGTGIVLYGVTVPRLPADGEAEIDAAEAVLDETLIMISAILRGEVSLKTLGLEVLASNGR